MTRQRLSFGLVAWMALCGSLTAFAQAKRKPLYEKVVARATNYLRTKGQAADGSFSRHLGPAITALVTTAVIKNGGGNDPMVAKSLKFLDKFVQKDGGIYQPKSLYRNYETSLAILCLDAANKGGRYTKTIKRARAFIRGLQWDKSEGITKSSPKFGGAGYGKHRRPDLSNTSYFVDALKGSKDKEDLDAIKRALLFISRCQNKESPHNTTPFAAKINDGGFYYTPANGGKSQAETTANGGLRSYASMTYAGLKSMIYAGVDPADLRVKAALSWIKSNYDLKSNPGLGSSGLFYYYHTFAKALHALKTEVFVDKSGKKHFWKNELLGELNRRQRSDGSWANSNQRWLESDPNLVTAYALMALSYCK